MDLKQALRIIEDHYGIRGEYVFVQDADGYKLDIPGLGTTLLKDEANLREDDPTEEDVPVLEAVFPPARLENLREIQSFLSALKRNGALGTAAGYPVSIQVNLEIEGSRGDASEFEAVLELLREYYAPEHQQELQAFLQIPDARKDYLGFYSPEMMLRLNSRFYRPGPRQFYDDFFYRQSLELVGEKSAWRWPIEKVKREIRRRNYPIVPKVVKLNSVRISSYLMHLFPDDPYTQAIVKSEWAVPRSLVELRDWNNDFDVEAPVRQALGLFHKVQTQTECRRML